MRVRRSGFALILVLIATAAVFALTMHGAVVSRTVMVESGAFVDRADAERGARSAAVLVLNGLVASTDRARDDDLEPLGFGQHDAAPAPPSKEDRDLPPIVKALLEAAGKQIEDEAHRHLDEEDRQITAVAESGGLAGRARRAGSYRVLASVGLPAAPVEVRLREDGPLYRVMITDASGLLAVNSVSERDFAAFLRAHGVEHPDDIAIAHQLLDWIDDDNFTRERGAEQPAYLVRGIICRNAPLHSLEEMLYFPGMTPEIFRRIRRDLAIAGDGRVHAGSASREVLLSIPGLTEPNVDQIIERRNRSGGLTQEVLDDILPIMAREARERLRAEPSNVLRILVESRPISGPSRHFEGLAILDDRGLASLAIRPL